MECLEKDSKTIPKSFKYNHLRPSDVEKIKKSVSLKKGGDEPKNKPSLRVILVNEVRGWFEETFELQDFPYDLQHLHICVTSRWDHKTVAITFDDNRGTHISSDTLKDQIWEMSLPRLFSFKHDWEENSLPLLSSPEDSATEAQYCRAYLALTVKRKTGHIFWNVCSLLILIGTMSFAVFAIKDPEDPDLVDGVVVDRQQVLLTLILTTTVFKYITMGMIPEIPHPTLIDALVLATLFFQFLMFVGVSITSFDKDPQAYDTIFCITSSVLWTTIVLYFVFRCFCLSWYRCRYIRHCNKTFKKYRKGSLSTPESKPELFKDEYRLFSPKSIKRGESVYFQKLNQEDINRDG